MSCVQNIDGDIISDVLVCAVLYPFAAVQMHDEAVVVEEEMTSVGTDSA
jgi:hypothetical protein